MQPRGAESKNAQNMSETALMPDVGQPMEIDVREREARSRISNGERSVEADCGA